MKLLNFKDLRITDCHIHYAHPSLKGQLLDICEQLGINRLNIVCTPDMNRLSLIPDALHLKSQAAEKTFVFGGLDVSVYFREPERVGKEFAESIDGLIEMGCDGIKMIEGKPGMRKMLPVPAFNSDVFAPYWEKMVEKQMPLVFHVNDPQEFWDEQKIPNWGKEQGWFYGDGSFIHYEEQYAEILDVLKNYPNLKVILAHFFFMSGQLERLGEILDEYPNVAVDLTPGIEMYFNFSKNLMKSRDFFIRYQDRILFGTDIGAKALLVKPEEGIQFDESRGRVEVVRSFLELEKEFELPETGFLFSGEGARLHGIGLENDVLEKIYEENFKRMVGEKPQVLNYEAIIAYCERLERMIAIMGSAQHGMPGDPSVARMVKTYFESRL